jgi:hypothetical protein
MSCWCGHRPWHDWHGPWHHWGYEYGPPPGPGYEAGYGPGPGYGPGYGPGPRRRARAREDDLAGYLEDLEDEVRRVREELDRLRGSRSPEQS